MPRPAAANSWSSALNVRQYQVPTTGPITDDSSPRLFLQRTEIAYLFHIYIKELAPWYDLNDSACAAFGTLVPVAALQSPLLFAAIISFAGEYAFRKYRVLANIAETFHERCLKLLISLAQEDETVTNGVALAATCLLRSYEILAEQEDPNRHLFGASTLVPPTPKLCDRGLLPCGFWNYLREDITYSLVHECPLKIQVGLPADEPVGDDEQANHITLLLASLVNAYFGSMKVDMLPSFVHWKNKSRAVPFSKVESEPFPSIRMLRDCHASALHYYLVAMCMLKRESRAISALEICGLAMHAESDSVVVNAYGPICFSARWLENDYQHQKLITWLRSTQTRTAWSVDVLIAKIQQNRRAQN